MIAREHDERVVDLPRSVEGIDHPAQVGIDAGAARQVLGVVPPPVPSPPRQVAGQVEVGELLGPALRPDRAEPIVLVVGFQERYEKEERPVGVEPAQPVDREVGEGIDAVAVQVDLAAVLVVDVTRSRTRGVLEGIGCDPGISVPTPAVSGNRLSLEPRDHTIGGQAPPAAGCQVPLPYVPGLVAEGVHPIGQRVGSWGKRDPVAPAPRGRRIHTGLQHSASRPADRLHRERLIERHAPRRQQVQPRRDRQPLAENTASIGTLLVRQDHQHIRTSHSIHPRQVGPSCFVPVTGVDKWHRLRTPHKTGARCLQTWMGWSGSSRGSGRGTGLSRDERASPNCPQPSLPLSTQMRCLTPGCSVAAQISAARIVSKSSGRGELSPSNWIRKRADTAEGSPQGPSAARRSERAADAKADERDVA